MFRTGVAALVVSALLSILLGTRSARGADASSDDPCPGAAAWTSRHQEDSIEAATQRDALITISNPDLLSELRRRSKLDQDARKVYLSQPHNPRAQQQVVAVDRENIAWLKQIVTKSGFPNREEIGEIGLHLGWLLLQHADQDPAFRASLVPVVVERFKSGEMSRTDVAKIIDRSLKSAGKPQKFGTQFDWLSGHFKLPANLADINQNRAELGLMPLEDYACLMNTHLQE